MTDRRHFFKQLAGIGLFTILPGAGRIWKAEAKLDFAWTNEQLSLYNKLPYYLAEHQSKYVLLCSKEAWKNLVNIGPYPANLGQVIRTINE